jgi:HEAT repeat protein
VAKLIALLERPDSQVKLNALNALRKIGPGGKLAEKHIAELLIDFDPQVRKSASNTLQALGFDPHASLKKALGLKDASSRLKAAGVMMSMNLEIDLAVAIFKDGLKSKDAALQTQAAYTLASYGLEADAVLPILIAGLKNTKTTVRCQSAVEIARYGTKARKAAPALITALDDTDDSVRAEALKTLAEIGGEAKKLLPALVKLLRNKDTTLHKPATKLFLQVGPEVVPDIVSLFKTDDSPAVRLACVQTLSMLCPPPIEAIHELNKALDDPSAKIRLLAARALGSIGPDAKFVLMALTKLTKAAQDSNANVQRVAKVALTQIQSDKDKKVFTVQGVLTDDDVPLDPVDKRYRVVHVYYMREGQTYKIRLISTTPGFDEDLRLESPQGKEVAQSCDVNLPAPWSQIHFTAPADGYYRIIVTCFVSGGTGGTGSYKLTVAEKQ